MRHDFVKALEKREATLTAPGGSDGVNLNVGTNMIYYLNVINNISRRARRTLSNFLGDPLAEMC